MKKFYHTNTTTTIERNNLTSSFKKLFLQCAPLYIFPVFHTHRTYSLSRLLCSKRKTFYPNALSERRRQRCVNDTSAETAADVDECVLAGTDTAGWWRCEKRFYSYSYSYCIDYIVGVVTSII